MANAFIDLNGSPMLLSLGSAPLTLGTNGAGAIRLVTGGYGGLNIKVATATLAGAAAATITTGTTLIPAGSLVLGVTVTVTSTFSNTSLTSMKLGDGSDDDRWGATIALTAGTQTTSANFTGTQPAFFASATALVATGTGADFAANGSMFVRAFYITVPGV